MEKNIWVQRNCGMCGEPFEAYGKQKYCSGECRSAAFRDRDSEFDGPMAKDPTLEEIWNEAALIRSGKVVVGNGPHVKPNWFVKRKRGTT